MTAAPAELNVKARLRNFGDGVLVLTDDAVRFYVESGLFKKRRKIIRDIPMADVESVERQGNDLSIFWKGTTDMFVIAQLSQVQLIFERMTAALKERTKDAEKKEANDQKQAEVAQMTAHAMETADSLFDILRNLHGRVDWSLVENNFKQSEENVKNLASQPNSVCLDIRYLSAAVRKLRPKAIAEKTHYFLKALHEHFEGMASSVEKEEQFHPNSRDARLSIQANYVLNDLLLGTVVGDEDIGKEGAELLKITDALSKVPDSKVDAEEVKAALDRLCVEKEKQNLILAEIRSVLGRQLKELFRSGEV